METLKQEKLKKLVDLISRKSLDWFKREICDLHDCPWNDGTCRVHNIQKTVLWAEDGCKIAKILLEED